MTDPTRTPNPTDLPARTDAAAGDRGLPWRALVTISGLAAFVGGAMHPQSPPELDFADDLAHMMASDLWVAGHGILTVAAAVLVAGLVAIRRRGAWPEVGPGLLRYAVLAAAAYTVELLFHTASVVDRDGLLQGDFGPVVSTHIALAFVAYPLFGAATALLAARFLRTWAVPMRPLAVLGIVAGVANGLAAPLTIGTQEPAFAALFPVGGVGTAAFFVGAGLAGLRRPAPVRVAVAAA